MTAGENYYRFMATQPTQSHEKQVQKIEDLDETKKTITYEDGSSYEGIVIYD